MARSLQGADEVIYVPTDELVAEAMAPNRRRKRRFEEAPEALELYGGQEGFLVRTALIRAADYDPAKAPILSAPSRAWPLLQHLGYADQEHVVILCMNKQQRLMAIHEAVVGGTASATIEKQHAVKVPVLVGASGVIISHNHPSGRAEFSPEDIALTRGYKEALDCVGVAFLDHILVVRDRMLSYLEEHGAP